MENKVNEQEKADSTLKPNPLQSQVFGNILLDPDALSDIFHAAEIVLKSLEAVTAQALTGMNRHQKNSIAMTRISMVEETMAVASEEPNFTMDGFDINTYKKLWNQLQTLRTVQTDLVNSERVTRDMIIVTADALWTLTLIYYNFIKNLSKNRVPLAEALFRRLRPFFENRSGSHSAEPTEKQILHDIKAVMHGKKDGEIVVKGHAAHTTPAERTVIDDTHKPHGAWKETEHGQICEHCGCENHGHHRFCHGCGRELSKL
jgi:hypothetical protein